MKGCKRSIFNFSLYQLLWKKGLYLKIIYALIPFLLIGIFSLTIYFSEAWKMEGYSFLADYSNCFLLFYVFIFIYFVHGLFLPYFHNQVDRLGDRVAPYIRQKYQRNINVARNTVTGCSLILSIVSLPFIFVANKTGDINWYSKLNTIELIYYSVLVVIAWVMSARLFSSILIDAIAIYKYTQQRITNLDCYSIDKKCGLKGLFNSLSASIGFGVYFLIDVVVIILSDFNAHRIYGLDLLAYKYWWLITGITIVLSVIYFSIIIISYISLHNTIKTTIQDELEKVKICDKKTDYLRHISSSFITLSDVCIFLLSVFFPGFAAIMQVIITII